MQAAGSLYSHHLVSQQNHCENSYFVDGVKKYVHAMLDSTVKSVFENLHFTNVGDLSLYSK